MKIKELVGKEVLDSNVKIIGRVLDLDFDPETFEIENLVVQRGNIQEKISIKKTEDLVPIDSILAIGDKVLLKDI